MKKRVYEERVMRKKLLVIGMILTLFIGLTAGCERQDIKQERKENKTEELIFYIRSNPVRDLDRIMEKANEIIQEKTDVRLKLITIDEANYAEKMNLLIRSDQAWDLCFTSNWGGADFYENVQIGAYADLTDLLSESAPETYSRIPKNLWDGVKVNDRIYALVNYQQWGAAQRNGFRFRKDLAEETGFDWQALKGKPTMEVLRATGEFIGEVLKTHPDMIGWETSNLKNLFADEPLYWDMEEIGEISTPGWIRYEQPEKVINQFETEEFLEFCKLMREWNQKGYVRKDGATLLDFSKDRKEGRIIAEMTTGWPDSVDFPENQNSAGMSMTNYKNAPSVSISNTRTILRANAALRAAVAVNAHSENIEKAVEVIELLNTDDELYKLITLGEEGIDYAYDEKGDFQEIEGKYFFYYNDWQIGQSYSPTFSRSSYAKNEKGEQLKKAQQIVFEADREAEASPLTGFVFDTSAVRTEIASCSQIIKELVPSLAAGALEPESGVKELTERLRTAGAERIIREKQAQLDKWYESKQ